MLILNCATYIESPRCQQRRMQENEMRRASATTATATATPPPIATTTRSLVHIWTQCSVPCWTLISNHHVRSRWKVDRMSTAAWCAENSFEEEGDRRLHTHTRWTKDTLSTFIFRKAPFIVFQTTMKLKTHLYRIFLLLCTPRLPNRKYKRLIPIRALPEIY